MRMFFLSAMFDGDEPNPIIFIHKPILNRDSNLQLGDFFIATFILLNIVRMRLLIGM